MMRIAPIVSAALFVAAAIMLGGASAAGVYANAAIQLAAALGIALSIVSRAAYPGGTQRALLGLLIAALGLVALQLIPLPPGLWTALPGRQIMADTLKIAGIAPGWRPLSMAPEGSVGAGLAILPVIAAALIGMRASRGALIVVFAAVTTMMIGSVLLGLMQKVSGPESPLYFYAITNDRDGVGFFANSNHFGVFCALSIPVVTALFVAQRGSTRLNAKWLLLAGVILFALLGIWAAGSAAGIGLGLVALVSVYAIARLHRGGRRTRYAALGIGALAVLTLAGILLFGPDDRSTGLAAAGTMGRASLWHGTIRAIAATLPVGTGLGSFPAVYPQFENPMAVTDVYANHAHNDYLEVVMTGGVPALILLAGFAVWWGRAAWLIWRAPSRDAFAEAASVVTAIVMIHETVDYPLRTAAVAVLFGLCCGVMARPRRIAEPQQTPERAGRHMAA